MPVLAAGAALLSVVFVSLDPFDSAEVDASALDDPLVEPSALFGAGLADE